jgi:hypothetical protein
MTVELIDADRFAEADRIPEVLRRLAAVQVEAEKHPLAHRDGLACFNHLYTIITGQVQDDYLAGNFASGDFITRLDVAFANRYLGALDAELEASPRPWQCLLEQRSDRWISPLAFALVGVSAHVNFDLAFAVVETGTQMGRLNLVDHTDYQHLNTIFFREMRVLRHHYEDGTERWLERAFGLTTLENLLGDAMVVVARYLAWHKAKRLWHQRAEAGADASAEHTTARSVGSLNRSLLMADRALRRTFSVVSGRIRGGRS